MKASAQLPAPPHNVVAFADGVMTRVCHRRRKKDGFGLCKLKLQTNVYRWPSRKAAASSAFLKKNVICNEE